MNSLLKISLITLVTLIMLLVTGPAELFEPDRTLSNFQNDTLKAGIRVPDGIFLKQGHITGFHYELLKRFASRARCHIVIKPCNSDNPWKMVSDGELDLLVADSENDTIPEIYQTELISGIELNQYKQVWVVRKSDYSRLEDMNHWISTFRQSREYYELLARYRKIPGNQTVRKFRGTKFLSPYDTLIKKYATSIEWDWRLLASLIYQESKFSMEAKSSRGAHGLMQIRQATAREFNIDNIYDPEQNIKAGTLMLRRLSRIYSGLELDSLNSLKLVLAAYNAGEGRVEDLRRYAIHKGADPNDWESIVGIIPSMRHSENIPGGVLRLGTFNGRETVRFVKEVLERYDYYKEFI
ncbi:MAG: transglycosylase SLT domain-containing protein [Bacteroidales bacterium]|nr:transglycosylase SLT domain-containing protein [Bacteroidales bacterium]MDD2424650.1 transglycosylase SLT domain-containing protein [Bacteroidales bacterium]MDD3989130.1 transglycosylase SLT domain-containing protein [Bacteroidales bacterium]